MNKNNVKIICLSGKARHGKDTFASMLEAEVKLLNKKVTRVAYGDLVKYISQKFFGATMEHNQENRKIWQHVGTDIVRMKDENYWANRLMEFIEITGNIYDCIIITDCRFPNEIEIPKLHFGSNVKTVRITRPNFDSGLTEEQLEHPSETSLDDYKFDYKITNKTMDGLLSSAHKLASMIFSRG